MLTRNEQRELKADYLKKQGGRARKVHDRIVVMLDHSCQYIAHHKFVEAERLYRDACDLERGNVDKIRTTGQYGSLERYLYSVGHVLFEARQSGWFRDGEREGRDGQ